MLLLVGQAALLLLASGRSDVGTHPDESTYLAVSTELLTQGDWLTPRREGEPVFFKPPLLYWLQAAALGLTGLGLPAVRLLSWLSTLGTAGLLFLEVRERRRSPQRGLLAASVFLSSVVVLRFGTLAMMDAPFTLALFGAFLASQAALARPRQLLGAGALVAVATLLKGPIGLVLGAVHLGAPWLSARRWPPARVLAGTLAVLGALAAPWFVAMLALHGDDFVTKFIVVEHLGKARIGRTLGGELSLALLPLLAVVPWVPFARPRPRTPWRAWLLVCAGVVAAYALQESRQLHYALPCAPFMALLVAERPSRWLRHALVGVFALAAALALFAAAIATPLPLRAVLAVLVLVATLGAVAAHRQQWLLAGLGLTALSTLALVGIPAVALPRSWPPALAAHVGAERVLMAGDEVGMARLETGVDLHRADRGPAPGDGLWLQRQVDPPPPGAVRLFTWPRLRQRVPPADLTAVLETGTLEPLLEPWELLRLPPGP